MDRHLLYETEHDILRRIQALQSRGLSFVPMTIDEITLSDRLVACGVLVRQREKVIYPSREKQVM